MRLEEKRGGEKRIREGAGIKKTAGERYGQRASCPSCWSVDVWRWLRTLNPTASYYTTKIRSLIKTWRDRHTLMDCSNLTCLNGDRGKETKACQGLPGVTDAVIRLYLSVSAVYRAGNTYWCVGFSWYWGQCVLKSFDSDKIMQSEYSHIFQNSNQNVLCNLLNHYFAVRWRRLSLRPENGKQQRH